MSNVRHIGTDFPRLIADGLEEMAQAIRAGGFVPHRAIVVICQKEAGADLIAGKMFGAESTLAETIGMLELAKSQMIEQAE